MTRPTARPPSAAFHVSEELTDAGPMMSDGLSTETRFRHSVPPVSSAVGSFRFQAL